jgi:hypothetical protein
MSDHELEELQKEYYRNQNSKAKGDSMASLGCMSCWVPPLLLFLATLLYAMFSS